MVNNGATPSVPTTVSAAAAGAYTWRQYLSSVAGVRIADAIWNPFAAALDALGDAFKGVLAAHAKASTLTMDQRLDATVRRKEQLAIENAAYGPAEASVTALRAATVRAREQLQAAILPSAPRGGTDSPMVALQTEQTIKYLEASGNSGDVIERAAGLLADALRTGDQLGAWIVASSPPVQMFYKRSGVSLPALFQRFAQVTASTKADGSDPSATTTDPSAQPSGLALLPWLTGGAFLGFIDAANAALYSDKQATLDSYRPQTYTLPR